MPYAHFQQHDTDSAFSTQMERIFWTCQTQILMMRKKKQSIRRITPVPRMGIHQHCESMHVDCREPVPDDYHCGKNNAYVPLLLSVNQ